MKFWESTKPRYQAFVTCQCTKFIFSIELHRCSSIQQSKHIIYKNYFLINSVPQLLFPNIFACRQSLARGTHLLRITHLGCKYTAVCISFIGIICQSTQCIKILPFPKFCAFWQKLPCNTHMLYILLFYCISTAFYND